MKRSMRVSAPIAAVVLAAAATLSGCTTEPEPEGFSRVCVDEEMQRYDDDECESGSGGRFHWFYVHSSHPIGPVGSKVTAPGTYVRPATGVVGNVSRGGFGGKTSSGS